MNGIKARIAGTEIEVTVIPYFPEGMFAGFTDVSGKLQPGMVVYKTGDLEFLETPPKVTPINWEVFRAEAAKDLIPLAARMKDYRDYPNGIIAEAIFLADELIRQLKK